MKTNFWNKLKKPIFTLAPMADVTDASFRRLIARYGKPDVFFTEFVSCDGLCSEEGRPKLMKDLEFHKSERPIIAQLFGSNPENFYESAKLVKKLGFDGIDINMGCPQSKILKQGAGADLINNPDLAKEIIRETKRGAGGLPVSVKTRIGYSKNEIETWLPVLLEEEPVAVTLHGRTKKEMSKTKVHWDVIKRGVEIRDEMKSDALVLGNGDIASMIDAKARIKESGVDGVMIGRGIFGNPWFFTGVEPLQKDKLKIVLEHTKLFEKIYGDTRANRKVFGGRARNFALMKKHFKSYVNGFDGAKELRMELMNTNSYKEVKSIIKIWNKK